MEKLDGGITMDVREKLSSEKRLIDANKLIDFIDVGHLRHPGERCYSEVDVANLLLNAPTVDAVEVVRCRDCFYYTPVNDKIGKCVFLIGENQYVVPDGYCYLGERKEGAD